MEPANKDVQIPKFCFREDGGRPQIKKYATNVMFRPNDQVYLSVPGTVAREGPYKVASVYQGRYTLCDANGNQVQGGEAFEENELKLYDPFE
ncbi:hypothetical protein EG329_010891 [Mollisiaceae sp. DMI_Dod_QoI]|nr:hypothetical protein EG329_010891 [Helotiales sp. DMI_Dod_QoI]